MRSRLVVLSLAVIVSGMVAAVAVSGRTQDPLAFLNALGGRRVITHPPANFTSSYILVIPKRETQNLRALLKKRLPALGFSSRTVLNGPAPIPIVDEYRTAHDSVTLHIGVPSVQQGDITVTAGVGESLVLVERGPTRKRASHRKRRAARTGGRPG